MNARHFRSHQDIQLEINIIIVMTGSQAYILTNLILNSAGKHHESENLI